VQIKALQLVASLCVLLGRKHPHRFFAGATTKASPAPSPPARTSSSPGGARKDGRKTRAADAKGADSLGDMLMRVIASVKCEPLTDTTDQSEEEEAERQGRRRRSALRMEAMRSLAVVCFILDDASITRWVCGFIAECYLARPQRLARDEEEDTIKALWRSYDSELDSEQQHDDIDEEESESDSDSDELNAKDGESQDSDEDEEEGESSDSLEEEGEEGEEDNTVSEEEEFEKDETRQHLGRRAEQAEALRVWSFLVSLLSDDEDVCAVVGPHKLSLIEMLVSSDSEDDHHHRDFAGITRNQLHLMKRSLEPEPCGPTGASLLRVQAADALAILALSSSHDSGNEAPMTSKDKRRLVALCVSKANTRGRGERVRGVERRACGKSERACFRRLAVELIHAGLGDTKTSTSSSKGAKRRDERASELGLAGSRRLETHVTYRARGDPGYYFAMVMYSKPVREVHMNELRGWRWSRSLSFLQRYFGSDFWTLLKVRCIFYN
jgi:hypothetical protein